MSETSLPLNATSNSSVTSSSSSSMPNHPELFKPETLIATKLYLPALNESVMARPRLSAKLDLAHKRSKLILVSAPAGFGKTTSVVEWLHNSGLVTRQKLAWLSLDESDNDPSRFWQYFATTLENVQPGLTRNMVALLHSQQPPSINQLLANLSNYILEYDQPLTLVLDDFHLITSPPIHEGLVYLLNHQPPRLRLVITSRYDLPAPFPVARMRVRGELAEIRINDLRFTLSEITELINSVMRLQMSPEHLAELENRTEGWIAALQLAALLVQTYPDANSFIKSFNGKHSFLLDYLAEEVLQHQPAHIQNFLIQTSIVDRLNPSLVEELTGCEDGQAMLRGLEQANLFLILLDQEQGWYRYHHLFREYLRDRLQRTQSEHLPLLNRLAAHWYEEHQIIFPAVDHAIAGQDFQYAAKLIDQSTQQIYERGELRTLLGWLKALPVEVIHGRPHMSSNYAWALILVGQTEAAVSYVQAEETGLIEIEAKKLLSPEIITALRGEIAALWAFIERSRGNFSGSLVLGQSALEKIALSQAFLRCAITVNQAYCYSALGDMEAAKREFQRAEVGGRECGSGYFMLLGIISQAKIQLEQGHLRAARDNCRRALRETELDLLPVMAQAHSVLGQIYFELNEMEKALQSLHRGFELLETTDDLYLVNIKADLVRVHLASGELEQAQAILETLGQPTTNREKTMVLESLKLELWLARNDLAPAIQWVNDATVEHSPGWLGHSGVRQLLVARVRLAQKQPLEVLNLASKAFESSQQTGRTPLMLESLVLQSVALSTQNQPIPASQTLIKALQTAEPEGYVQVFVRAGPVVAKLLVTLADANPLPISDSYLALLLSACKVETGVAVAIHQASLSDRSLTAVALPEPLTEREIDVLRLLVTTSLNSIEMAENLSIAVSTVRTHVKNLYSKLEVQNRLEAIKRSQELRLL